MNLSNYLENKHEKEMGLKKSDTVFLGFKTFWGLILISQGLDFFNSILLNPAYDERVALVLNDSHCK